MSSSATSLHANVALSSSGRKVIPTHLAIAPAKYTRLLLTSPTCATMPPATPGMSATPLTVHKGFSAKRSGALSVSQDCPRASPPQLLPKSCLVLYSTPLPTHVENTPKTNSAVAPRLLPDRPRLSRSVLGPGRPAYRCRPWQARASGG